MSQPSPPAPPDAIAVTPVYRTGVQEPALAEAAKADINEIVAGRMTDLLGRVLERILAALDGDRVRHDSGKLGGR